METKQIKGIEIGRTYFSGNTFNPRSEKVLKIVSYANLPASAKKDWEILARGRFHDEDFVLTLNHNSVCPKQYLPRSVFVATHYETVDAMVQAYKK